MNLEGKTVLVTGAGSGMGRAIAQSFALAGSRVIGVGRTESKLRETVAGVKDKCVITARVVDVSSKQDVLEFAEAMLGKFGAPDILVNNAGVNIANRRITDLSMDDWDYVIDVNLNGVFYMIFAFLPAMRQRGSGLIINISSIAGVRPSVLGGAAYSASKFGLNSLSGVVALEAQKDGIRSTVICPGEVNTPILDDRPEPVSEERRARMLQPQDVADACLFLARLPDRAHVPELIIKPANQDFA